jgi:NAD(P)-dependent dehydrogenase (short-subunit alcohol dehydrogenase family)
MIHAQFNTREEMTMGVLQDKVCVVTGAAGSIGLASIRKFLAEGAKVMLVDRTEDGLRQAVEGLPADRVAWRVGDVRESASVREFIEAAVARFGLIDVLFSNAGNSGVIAPLEEYPEEVFDDVYRVHVRGGFLVCKYGIPKMNDGGSVIITSSVAGLRGDRGVYAYITAKHAQVGLMRCMAKEGAARKIRVNTLHPGPTQNAFQDDIEERLTKVIHQDAGKFFDDMIPLGRHATPDEIAACALFLASPQSSYVTGSLLVADGGMSA